MAQKNMDPTYQALAAAYAHPESPAEQAIHDALENGRREITGTTYAYGINDYKTGFKDYLPDGSVRYGTVTEHLDGSKETYTRYPNSVDVFKTGVVETTIKNGVETVTFSSVPGINAGDSRPAPLSHSTAAGLVPSSWSPPDHDGDNSGGTTGTSGGPGHTDGHDPGFSTGPVFGSSGGGTTAAGPTGTTSTQHACGEATDCNTGGAWEPGAAHQSLAPATEVTVENTADAAVGAEGGVATGSGAAAGAASAAGAATGAGAVVGGGSGTGGDGDKTDDQHKGDDGNNNDGKHDDDNNGDEKPTEETPGTGPEEGMPNPDGTGPGSPTSTPNPEGGDDGGESGHHGPTVNQGSDVGHLSTQLAAVGNSQDGSTTDGYHGPHDPGEEMPDPDSNGGGNPISNVAHGATSFWDQAATVMQGATTQGATTGTASATQTATSGLQLSALAVSEHASASQLASGVATTSHDIAGALSDTSAHAAFGTHDFAASGAVLHGELGTATLHDALTLSSGAFATQMHV